MKVDFAQIDKMALSIGVEKRNLRRVGTGIKHALNLASINGNSCVLEGNIITYVSKLLGIQEDDVSDGIKDLKAKEEIIVETREEIEEKNGRKNLSITNWIYLADFYAIEKNSK